MALKPEKRERIINAGIDEFAKNGYERASTNEITKAANIAKGSLFNYFGSKKDLYFFLLDEMIKVLNRIYEEIDWNETDLFERLHQITEIKRGIMKKYPQAFAFLLALIREKSDQVEEELEKIIRLYTEEALGRVFVGIDYSKFREDVDLKKMLKIINWTMMSYAAEEREKSETFEITEEQIREFDEYMGILKRCFYR